MRKSNDFTPTLTAVARFRWLRRMLAHSLMSTIAALLAASLVTFLVTSVARAQSVAVAASQARATVVGSVHDSLARKPLSGAIVQVAKLDTINPHNHTARADSLGRFRVDSVPAGKYMVGFFHPLLDSLGIEPPVRELLVNRDGIFRTDLAIPSAESFRTSICGAQKSKSKNADALLLGIVRNANSRTVAARATVSAEWEEVGIKDNAVLRTAPFVRTTAADNGWFAICHVPSKGSLTMFAALGADSTERIEFDLSDAGFSRRDLYLSGPVAHRASTPLSGRVISHDAATPVAGADVIVAGARSVRTNARGEFAIADAPAGTRMIEVRAVGYLPFRGPVNVIDGTPPLNLELAPIKNALATVRVTSQRTSTGDMQDFEFRRKTGIGRFITAEQLERSRPVTVSEIFRFIPGMSLAAVADSGITRVMFRRGAFPEPCTPDFFIDGRPHGSLTSDELDTVAKPAELKAVEIYVSPNTPHHFSNGTLGSQCGAILIWTKFR